MFAFKRKKFGDILREYIFSTALNIYLINAFYFSHLVVMLFLFHTIERMHCVTQANTLKLNWKEQNRKKKKAKKNNKQSFSGFVNRIWKCSSDFHFIACILNSYRSFLKYCIKFQPKNGNGYNFEVTSSWRRNDQAQNDTIDEDFDAFIQEPLPERHYHLIFKT